MLLDEFRSAAMGRITLERDTAMTDNRFCGNTMKPWASMACAALMRWGVAPFGRAGMRGLCGAARGWSCPLSMTPKDDRKAQGGNLCAADRLPGGSSTASVLPPNRRSTTSIFCRPLFWPCTVPMGNCCKSCRRKNTPVWRWWMVTEIRPAAAHTAGGQGVMAPAHTSRRPLSWPR